MANEFWNTLNTATSALKNIDAMYNESQINDRVNAIAHALVDNGNNLEALDPSLYSDSYGLAALGRVTKQYSETSEGQKKIAENAIARAQRDGQMIGGYLNAINEAIQNGDTDRGGAYFQSLSERIGTPYTVQYDPRTKELRLKRLILVR